MTPTAPDTTSQPPADDVVDVAARLRLSVTRLARILRRQAEADLTPTQLAALATVQRSGPLPVGALAEIEHVTPPTATKAVDKLEAAGLVSRTVDPDDRRVALVAMTDAGEALLGELRDRKTAWLRTRLHELDPAELAIVATAVEVLERLSQVPQDER